MSCIGLSLDQCDSSGTDIPIDPKLSQWLSKCGVAQLSVLALFSQHELILDDVLNRITLEDLREMGIK